MNPQFWRTFGYDPAERKHLASEWKHMINQEDLAQVLHNFKSHCADSSHPFDQVVRYTHKSGSTVWVRCRGLAIRDADGNPIRMLGAHTDVTPLKRVEEQLTQQTLELMRSNKDLEQFAYVASHDLQQPLRTIASYLEIIKEDLGEELSEETAENLKFVTDAALRMQGLVKGLLEWSRVSQGHTPTDVNMYTLIREVVADLVVADLAVTNLSVADNFDPLDVVLGDEEQLRRVLLNLVNNARKYCRYDVDLHLELTSKRHANHIEFAMADNGQGIDPQYQEKVFDLFARLHHQDDIPGTGLGLSVVRRILNLHGGRIWVESEGAGKGSTFRFTLPTPKLRQLRQESML